MDGSEFTRALAVWFWILSLLSPLYLRDFLYVLLFLFHPSLGGILLFVIQSLLAWQWERSSVGVYSLCFELASALGRYCISGLGKGYVSQFSCLYPSCIVVPVYNPAPPWFFSPGAVSFHQCPRAVVLGGLSLYRLGAFFFPIGDGRDGSSWSFLLSPKTTLPLS